MNSESTENNTFLMIGFIINTKKRLSNLNIEFYYQILLQKWRSREPRKKMQKISKQKMKPDGFRIFITDVFAFMIFLAYNHLNMKNSESKKIVLITGASSGIGMDTALRLLKKGYTVYGAARRTNLLSQLEQHGGHSIYLDLYDEQSMQDCVQTILQKEGRIDILINNAGFGLGGALETIPIETAKKQLDVNVFGLIRMTQLVLPSMRNNHSGKIINISSIAGKFSSPFMGWYHASKYCVEALSDALRLEAACFGIKVIIIEPGLIKTDWGIIAADYIEQNTKNTAYEYNGKNTADFYNHRYRKSRGASKICVISKAIEKAVQSKHPKLRYRAGKNAMAYIIAGTFLPGAILDLFKKMLFKIK